MKKLVTSLPFYQVLALLIVLGLGFLTSNATVSCKPVANPPVLVEAGVGIVDNTCTLLEGFTQNQTVITICAYVEEVATIATFIVNFLRHGATQAADAGTCTPLPGTGVCATKSELGQAIQLIVQKRKVRLMLDAGVLPQ